MVAVSLSAARYYASILTKLYVTLSIFFFASTYGRVASQLTVNLEILYNLKLVRKFIQNNWVLRSDTQLIPWMTSENSLLLVTWSGSKAWTEVGAELMRRTLSLSKAEQQEMKWEVSSVRSPQSYTMGHQERIHCFCSGISPHLFLGRHIQPIGGSWSW